MVPYASVCMCIKFTGPESGLEKCIKAVPIGEKLCHYCKIFAFKVTNSTLTNREEVIGWMLSVGAMILMIIPFPISMLLLLSTSVVVLTNHFVQNNQLSF